MTIMGYVLPCPSKLAPLPCFYMHSIKKPQVGVSRCLLGDAVRYDGDSKASRIVIEQLAELFELIPVCPEVEAGLTVPRPPVQLTGSIESPRLTGRDDPGLDITELMRDYCAVRPASLSRLSGFVFKSRSPSCGLHSAPVFIDGACVTGQSSGVFARTMIARYPELPVIEETDLESADQYRQFIDRVFHYASISDERLVD